MMGGIMRKLFWKEYVALFETKEVREELEACREYVIDHNLIGTTGFNYQDAVWEEEFNKLCPTVGGFSFRSWGDFMAAIVNTEEGEKRHDYCSFAW